MLQKVRHRRKNDYKVDNTQWVLYIHVLNHNNCKKEIMNSRWIEGREKSLDEEELQMVPHTMYINTVSKKIPENK